MFDEPQLAFNESQSGDTIILRSGQYSAPLLIPAHDLTIGSEYVLDQNQVFIENCVISPSNANPNVRCFDTEPATGITVQLNLIGMTIQDAYSVAGDGGGVRLRNRIANIYDCVIKRCAGINGGAVFADTCALEIVRTSISGCDALSKGRCLFAGNSKARVSDSRLNSSSAIMFNDAGNPEIYLRNSPLSIVNSTIRDMGYSSEGRTTIIGFPDNSTCDSVALYNCTVNANSMNEFFPNGPGELRHLVIDSCHFLNNEIAFGILMDEAFDSLRSVLVTNSIFENNRRPGPNFGGQGLFSFTSRNASAIVEGNYFLFNDGGAFSCIFVNGQHDPATYRVQRNHFSGNTNTNFAAPPGGAVHTLGLAEGICEFNGFNGNLGHAFDTWEFGSIGYAKHNFWGDSTGPYVAVEHPQGHGDTTDTDTIYDEWFLSADEIPDTSLFPNSVSDTPLPLSSSWQLGAIYPNPFNSEIRIEIDGATGPDFEVRLFDLLGREVALLYSGKLLGGTLTFAAPHGLAAGVYFLRARDHTYAETKKILFLK